MTVSKDYFDFIDKLDTYRPRFGEQYRLPFAYEQDEDDGNGRADCQAIEPVRLRAAALRL
jgi:hypothetical protein